MAMINYTNLDSNHIDVLKEIGNIGSGHAATALATMLDTFVDIDVPQVCLMKLSDLPEALGDYQSLALGISVKLEGDIGGVMYHVIRTEFATKLINRFYPKEITGLDILDDMDMSVLREMSNITCAAYANSLASLTGMFINIAPPEAALRANSAIMDAPTQTLSAYGDTALFIDQIMKIDNAEINSHMLLILDIESLNKFFRVLGIEA